MKRSICLILAATMFAVIPSCSLIGTVLKLPVRILKTATRVVGVSNLTDEKPQPEHDLEAPKKEGETPVTLDSPE